ncbi:Ribosomal-protein-alanine acetyltransferase [BD1-7 clade bacterium]|uniref:Ribosomal-protein-alanine acetyltransferase n=1 Tax=BD1-7 clade bacterium TaxID=2029982 RepID=A0A5S9QJA7_9GAMM|nr:Ribosomal-protein-alanine acetyltransferase [BD1-7 clade bacterium]CAA0118914.1 Ribosomal-protein-alanine acetyltransferase [BD1-7 clade bacterium]
MIDFRLATLNDLDSMALLEAADGYSRWTSGAIRTALERHSVWLCIERNNSDEMLCGFAIFSRVLDEAELLNIVIDPGYQGRSLGARLLARGFSNLSDDGICHCFLEVGQDNGPAIALYEKLGFKLEGHRKGYYKKSDSRIDALIYCKNLDKPN